jgi:hypothetical protein
MLGFRSCAILLCSIVVLLLLLLEAAAAVVVMPPLLLLLLLVQVMLLQVLLLRPQLMLHWQWHLEVPPLLLPLWLLLLWLRLLRCPLRCVFACLRMLCSLHCSVTSLECFAYMLRIIFLSGGEVALASTRSILPRGLFGRTLFKEALVPFEGPTTSFTAEFGRSSWALLAETRMFSDS